MEAGNAGLQQSIVLVDLPTDAKAWQPGEPMHWFGGALRADISVNERFECRENWLDYNDGYDMRNDVGPFRRLRFGLTMRPTSWLTVYGQVQDSRTFFDETAGDVGDPFHGFRAHSASPEQTREFVCSNSSIDLCEGWMAFGAALRYVLQMRRLRRLFCPAGPLGVVLLPEFSGRLRGPPSRQTCGNQLKPSQFSENLHVFGGGVQCD